MAFRCLATRIKPNGPGLSGAVTTLSTSSFRASLQPMKRPYSTHQSREGGSNIMLFVGLTALGGAGHYYYRQNPNLFGTAKKVNSEPVDYEQVYKDISAILENNDYDDGSYGPVLLRLAWHASGTYDVETKTGGSNSASMRFEPEASHGANNGLKIARDLLEPIKAKYPGISYGDLWTLAGVCAIQELGGPSISWRPGRTDGLNAESCARDGLLPDATKKENHIRDIFYRMGFDDQEIVALTGAHALGRCHPDRSGFDGPWSEQPTLFSNEYYKVISERQWVKKDLENGGWQWVDKSNPSVMMLPAEIAMFNDKEFRKYFELYAKDQDKFFKDFAKAFGKLIELGVPFKGDEKVYKFEPVDA